MEYKRKVFYYETDQMGIVHHSNYIRWFEEARIEYMEEMGLGYGRMEEEGIISPVLSVEADYLRMLYFGDKVIIDAYVREYNGIKLTVGYEVINEETGKVHCRGSSKHCFLSRDGRPLSLKQANPKLHALFEKALHQHKEKMKKMMAKK